MHLQNTFCTIFDFCGMHRNFIVVRCHQKCLGFTGVMKIDGDGSFDKIRGFWCFLFDRNLW